MSSQQVVRGDSRIRWISLRGALKESQAFCAFESESKSTDPRKRASVVDVIEPLTERVVRRLGQLSSDDLVIILSTGTQSDTPTETERHYMAVEEAVKAATPAAWVTFRCSPFAQEFLGSMWHALNESIFASWDERPVPWLDFDDVIDMVLLVIGDPTRRTKTYELTGAEKFEPQELADIVGRIFEVPFHYVHLGREQMVLAISRMLKDLTQAQRQADYMAITTGPDMLLANDLIQRATGRAPRSGGDVILSEGEEAYKLALDTQSRYDERAMALPNATRATHGAQ